MITLFMFLTSLVFIVDASSSSSDSLNKVSSRLQVQIPTSLYQENGYDHRVALFGTPTYYGSMAQNVYYTPQKLCTGDVDTTLGSPSRPYDQVTRKMQPWASPYILMVDRGGCTLATKVRNAQSAGADGVVIADDKCFCSDSLCLAQIKTTVCKEQEPIVSNDGSGGADVTIPSYLIFKLDAENIKVELTANRPVQIEMSWNLPIPDGRVEYDLWTTPSDMASLDFFRSFKTIAEALGDRAYFTPHMYINDGARLQCQGTQNGQSRCANLCTNNGRYCSTDPGNDLLNFVTGADVVRESLRRLCIWSTYGARDGIGATWWDYVSLFNERCAAYPAKFVDQNCIQNVYQAAKIDGKSILNCMMDSGGTTADGTNVKLSTEISAQYQRGVVIVPTVFVDTAPVRSALSVNNVFSAICSKYTDGSAPDVCSLCADCADSFTCVKKGSCSANSTKPDGIGAGISTSLIIMSMLIVIGFLIGAGNLYHKREWATGEILEQISSLRKQ